MIRRDEVGFASGPSRSGFFCKYTRKNNNYKYPFQIKPI